MSAATYTVSINRPLHDVVDYLEDIETRHLPAEGGLSFEDDNGWTRIRYISSRGRSGFFKLADLLIRELTNHDDGANVPELIFEAA
jgi:hypothetical protein